MDWNTPAAEHPRCAMFAVAAAALELVVLWFCRLRVRDTTLIAAWWWTVAATLALAATEVAALTLEEFGQSRTRGAVRFIAAGLTFCPAMAALGAKRPQHRAWQLVVLALWGILALPALENLVLRGGQTLEIDSVRAAFLAGLIALGVLNWLPTRHGLTAMLVAAGQTLLYAEHLSLASRLPEHRAALAAAAFLLATLAFLATDSTVRRARRTLSAWDREWLDFRDLFGALWALRVAERVNAAAATHGWPVRLTWKGYRPADGSSIIESDALPLEVGQALQTATDNLLRRFVGPAWIAKRRETGVH
jgi:hypothetical protein